MVKELMVKRLNERVNDWTIANLIEGFKIEWMSEWLFEKFGIKLFNWLRRVKRVKRFKNKLHNKNSWALLKVTLL